MRRYCRSVDITDIKFIERCILKWMQNKKRRNDVHILLAQHSGYTATQIAGMVEDGRNLYGWLLPIVNNIATDVSNRIRDRKIDLPPIKYKMKYDQGSNKWREIGIQRPIHQIFDYVAVVGCEELFDAKIGMYQMASLPGKGQEKGAATILRWLQTDEKHTRYYAQADVRQCYPSIDHDILKAMFTRDIKNPALLWLIYELIDSFPRGLSIGSYFSQYTCNYFLSRGYHYASEQLFKERRKRSGKAERIRLVYHVMFYMDDILFLGSSRKDVSSGMEQFGEFLDRELGLQLKPGWLLRNVDYIGKDGEHHGSYIDMMGYRVYRDHMTARRRTYRRMRRAMIRANARIESGRELPVEMAQRALSYCAKIQHTDCARIWHKYNIGRTKQYACKTISSHDRLMAEKRRRKMYESGNCSFAVPPGGGGVQSAVQ